MTHFWYKVPAKGIAKGEWQSQTTHILQWSSVNVSVYFVL
jgi:hypothetical protein